MKRFIFTLFAMLIMPMANAQKAPSILIWGDSLSAAYGIPHESAWPNLLIKKLASEAYHHAIANPSISGETTAGGLQRLPEALARIKPAVVVIELGANDGLRGLPIPAMRKNLAAMIQLSQKAGAKVMLIGMRMPPNFGPVYTQKFQQVFIDLAKEYKTALLPFMMEGFAQREELFQSDNLHPSAAAQPLILNNVWPVLKPLLTK